MSTKRHGHIRPATRQGWALPVSSQHRSTVAERFPFRPGAATAYLAAPCDSGVPTCNAAARWLFHAALPSRPNRRAKRPGPFGRPAVKIRSSAGEGLVSLPPVSPRIGSAVAARELAPPTGDDVARLQPHLHRRLRPDHRAGRRGDAHGPAPLPPRSRHQPMNPRPGAARTAPEPRSSSLCSHHFHPAARNPRRRTQSTAFPFSPCTDYR